MTERNLRRERLIEKRVRALATLLLTDRHDLTVLELETEEVPFDLLVTIHAANKPGVRQLGVKLHGALAGVSETEANKALRPILANLQHHGPFPFPVCIFFSTMREPQNWWTWATEPHVTSGAAAELIIPDRAECRPLDAEALDAIIELVVRWYDFFFANFVHPGPLRQKVK